MTNVSLLGDGLGSCSDGVGELVLLLEVLDGLLDPMLGGFSFALVIVEVGGGGLRALIVCFSGGVCSYGPVVAHGPMGYF